MRALQSRSLLEGSQAEWQLPWYDQLNYGIHKHARRNMHIQHRTWRWLYGLQEVTDIDNGCYAHACQDTATRWAFLVGGLQSA